jgi:hypothetical protein
VSSASALLTDDEKRGTLENGEILREIEFIKI